MARLTERFSNGQAAVRGCGIHCKHHYEFCDLNKGNCPTLNEIYEKLAFYEDLEEKGELPVMYGVNYLTKNPKLKMNKNDFPSNSTKDEYGNQSLSISGTPSVEDPKNGLNIWK